MASLLVSPQTLEELQLLIQLLERMNITTHVLTEEEKEDLGLALLLKDAERSEKVSREEIMRKLRRA